MRNGEETGWLHARLVEFGEGEDRILRTDRRTYERLLIGGDVLETRKESWSIEDAGGRLLQEFSRREDAGDVVQKLLSVREGGAEMITTTLGVSRWTEVTWTDDVPGFAGRRRVFREHGDQPGTS